MAGPKFETGQSAYDNREKNPCQIVEVYENMGGFGVHAYGVRYWPEFGGQVLVREASLRPVLRDLLT